MSSQCLKEVMIRDSVLEFLGWEVKECPIRKEIFWIRDVENFADSVIVNVLMNYNGKVVESPVIPPKSQKERQL